MACKNSLEKIEKINNNDISLRICRNTTDVKDLKICRNITDVKDSKEKKCSLHDKCMLNLKDKLSYFSKNKGILDTAIV